MSLRTATLEIDDKRYLLCYSAAAALDVQDNVDGLHDSLDRMVQESSVRDAFRLCELMMRDGYRWAQINGVADDYDVPPEKDSMPYMIGPQDVAKVIDAVSEALLNGTKTTVEVEDKQPKKGKTTRGRS